MPRGEGWWIWCLQAQPQWRRKKIMLGLSRGRMSCGDSGACAPTWGTGATSLVGGVLNELNSCWSVFFMSRDMLDRPEPWVSPVRVVAVSCGFAARNNNSLGACPPGISQSQCKCDSAKIKLPTRYCNHFTKKCLH